MSIVSTLASGAIAILERFVVKTTVLTTVAGVSITAGGLEASAGTIAGFLTEFQAAVKAKNYPVVAELTIEEALTIAADLGAPYAGIAAQVLPIVFDLINSGLIPVSMLIGDLSHNAGETQSQDITSSVGL